MCGCLVSIFLGLVFLAWLIGALAGALFPYVLAFVVIVGIAWVIYAVFFIDIGKDDEQ